MSKAVISLSGTVGKDADIRSTSNGFMANFSVATNARQKDREGNWNDIATWWEVTTFAKSEDWLRSNFYKGSKVFVSGEVTANQWTDRDGNKRTSLRVTASHAEGLVKPTENAAPRAAERPQARPQQEPYGDDLGDIPFAPVRGPW